MNSSANVNDLTNQLSQISEDLDNVKVSIYIYFIIYYIFYKSFYSKKKKNSPNFNILIYIYNYYSQKKVND